MSAYLPIAEHGVIGDLHTRRAGRHRRHDRLVLLPAVRLAQRVRVDPRRREGRLLPDRAGNDGHTTKQLYFPDTNVLITRFLTADGVGEVQDFMPIHRDPRPRAPADAPGGRVRGEMRFALECRPRFDYGRGAA